MRGSRLHPPGYGVSGCNGYCSLYGIDPRGKLGGKSVYEQGCGVCYRCCRAFDITDKFCPCCGIRMRFKSHGSATRRRLLDTHTRY